MSWGTYNVQDCLSTSLNLSAPFNNGVFQLTYTLVKPLQPEKALSPIFVTLEGMVTLVKPLQPEKAEEPISVTLEGMVTLVKPLQPEKVEEPIFVMLEGMVTLVKLLQKKKVLLVDYQYYTL